MSLYTKIIDRQKLDAGWQKVMKNKPAAGVDGVTCNMFHENKREYLKQLHLELSEYRYHPQPVKLVKLYQGDKERIVALYSMRDKVVQQSIAAELQKIYEPFFSKTSYAYRSGRSALEAVEKIEQYMANKGGWVLRMDIHSFFDSISQDRLQQELKRIIKEEDVINLIMENACAQSLEFNGEISRKTRGIWQGSSIAPVLSNIYLKDFDHEMERKTAFFVRYSDDMLVMAQSEKEAAELLRFVKVYMEKYNLVLNEEKTILTTTENGVDFLGYRFSETGKSVPVKAEMNLQEKLEQIFLLSRDLPIKEKLKKGAEVLEGWEQYYREERQIHSIWEYVVVLYMVQNKEKNILEKICNMRPLFKNGYKELTKYMAELWKQNNRIDLQLLEYEQFFVLDGLDEGCIRDYTSPFIQELLSGYEKLMIYEDQEILAELVQDYTELKCLNRASNLMERYQKLQKMEYEVPNNPPELPSSLSLSVSEGVRQMFYDLFVGREDTYSEEYMFQRRTVEQKNEPLTDDVLKAHLSGKRTICTYVQRSNSTAKYLVIDMDVSKKMLLKYSAESGEVEQYKKQCFHMSCALLKILGKMGLKGYLEDSGCRGYHLWIFFTEWIPVRYIHVLSQIIAKEAESIQSEGIELEYFPDGRRIRAGKAGQSIKLPLGINSKSGKRGNFFNENFEVVTELSSFLKDIAKFSLPAIKKVIDLYAGENTKDFASAVPEYHPDLDLDGFEKLSSGIKTVLEGCNLMCYLCQKARKTGYLSHFERQSVLYVFGHMGDEGKEFIHQIMGYTLNYQYQVTQKFINRIPEKPISCVKLREQYQRITAEIGCSCSFKRTKNCYPSPVLHALKSADVESEQITIPSSRTLSKEKEQTLYQEVNVYRKVQELAEKILEMKRQRRGMDKKISKIERELETVFDGIKADCLEIEMGLLCRRKKEDGSYEWVIEL